MRGEQWPQSRTRDVSYFYNPWCLRAKVTLFVAEIVEVVLHHVSDCTAKNPKIKSNKMKECNPLAKGQKGAERKTFMKGCLSKKKA